MQPRDWEQLVERLGSGDFGTRMETAAALCGAGEDTLRALSTGLRHAQWKVRWRCAELLGFLLDEDNLEPLCRALEDPSVRVRRAALHALLSIPCEQAQAQASVTQALRERIATDRSITVRRRAVHGLGLQAYDPGAMAMLSELASGDPHPKLRRLAQWALQQQQSRQREETGARRSREASWPSGPAVLGLTPEAELPGLKTLEATQLVELLGVRERRLRFEATGVLLHRGPDSLDAVTAGLTHSSVTVRRACASLLDHLADDRCVGPLSSALRDADEQVRRSALHSLTCDACKPSPLQGDLVAPFIERALHDPHIRVRRVATGVLGNYVTDTRAVAALRSILEQDTDPILRFRAQSALDNA